MPFEAPGLIDFYQGLQKTDRDIAKHRSDMETQRLQQEAQSLENMFNQQYNPMRLQEKQQTLDYTNATQQFKINDELAGYAKKAKQEELDEMFREGQRMLFEGAKANNPEMMQMGERIVMAHKDFLKLREQGQQKVELQGVKAEDTAEQIRLRAALRPPKATGSSGGGAPKPLGMDKLISSYTQKALEAEAAGDTTTAQQMWARAQAATELYSSRRPDTNAGKPSIGPSGQITTAPPRGAPQLPNTSGAPVAQKPAQPSLADVQKMYPGVPADKLREAYKKKFGVDLR